MIIQIQKLRMAEALAWILQHGDYSDHEYEHVAGSGVHIRKAIVIWEGYIQRYGEAELAGQTVDIELSLFPLSRDRMALFKLMFS